MATSIKYLIRNVPKLPLEEARTLLLEHYKISGELHPLSGERDLNFRVVADDRPYVFKIGNADDDEAIVSFQTSALRHLHAQDAELPVPRVIADERERDFSRVTCSDDESHIIRLTTYLPGEPFGNSAANPAHWRQKGALIARVNTAFGNFFHPAGRSNNHLWDLARCGELRPFIKHISSPSSRQLVDTAFDRFDTDIKARLQKLRHQVIHQDGHGGNVLVTNNGDVEITGLIDFGDMLFGTPIADVAIACSSTADDDRELIETMAATTAGFDSVLPQQEGEIDLLFDLICARHAVVATVVAARIAQDEKELDEFGDASDHLATLDRLFTLGRSHCTRALRRACRFPSYGLTTVGESVAEESDSAMLAKRHQLLGATATHFYDRPLHFEKARGVYLYATDGNRYLDCYNNVPQVGHCNPHVVTAIARQAATLNTNTRYLYGSILEYAERLTEKLAPHLDACVFVNSGSEANDIAWQMAQAVTGKTGGLLMEDAYHGITQPIRQFSPGHPGTKLPDHLQGLMVPDTYRGPYRENDANAAERYADDADQAIAALNAAGHAPAAFMIDSAFCSSGVTAAPNTYLLQVEKRVRNAGALMICDEVQSGFGRMGQWWGHEFHGVRADIVTMGKPVANGHPLGIIVTSAAILNEFNTKMRLFSTFGGNTVACAAGNAVLDVIERDGLIERGRDVGDYLRSRLCELATTQSLIGNVRGHGMLTGLEFVSDREQRTAATNETAQLLELMRQRQVLVGSEGRDGNILKLRPPLVFENKHVDQFTEALDSALSELNQRPIH